MVKVCAAYGKKVPTTQPYSSQQFHASVEIELSDALSPGQLQARIHQTFALVRQTVETEIQGGAADSGRTPAPPSPEDSPTGTGKASNAQLKYLTTLATAQGLRLRTLNAYCHNHYQRESIYDLSKPQASRLVDLLQARQAKRTPPAPTPPAPLERNHDAPPGIIQ